MSVGRGFQWKTCARYTSCDMADINRAPTEADATQIAMAAFSPLSAKTIGQLLQRYRATARHSASCSSDFLTLVPSKKSPAVKRALTEASAPQYLTFGYMQRPLAVWEAQHF